MKKRTRNISIRSLSQSLVAMLVVLAVTIPVWLIGRDTLGEAGVSLIYLLPISWSAVRWGQLPGISAALTAALAFNFLFIPPFFTFTIARLEGWLVLAIFICVAIIVVGQIQSAVNMAREMTFSYELCSSLSEARTPEAVAHTLTRQIQQLFQASLVRVHYQDNGSSKTISKPTDASPMDQPDLVLPIVNAWGVAGEIQVWRGTYLELPAEDSRLLQNFSSMAGRAFKRVQDMGAGNPHYHVKPTQQSEKK